MSTRLQLAATLRSRQARQRPVRRAPRSRMAMKWSSASLGARLSELLKRRLGFAARAVVGPAAAANGQLVFQADAVGSAGQATSGLYTIDAQAPAGVVRAVATLEISGAVASRSIQMGPLRARTSIEAVDITSIS